MPLDELLIFTDTKCCLERKAGASNKIKVGFIVSQS